MIAKLIDEEDVKTYDKIIQWNDTVAVELDKNYPDILVEEYLNGFDMVAISRTNCPICGEEIRNGQWLCTCLSEDAQTKFMWRYG